jgi:hypothetical protein
MYACRGVTLDLAFARGAVVFEIVYKTFSSEGCNLRGALKPRSDPKIWDSLSPGRTECGFPIHAWQWRGRYGFGGLRGPFGVTVRDGKDDYVRGCDNEDLSKTS